MRRFFFTRLFGVSLAIVLSFYTLSCGSGGGSPSGSTSSYDKAFAQDLALASPTAGNSTTSISPTPSENLRSFAVGGGDKDDDVLSHQDKVATLEAIRNATTLQGCFQRMEPPFKPEKGVLCQGPFVKFTGTHPNGTIDPGNQVHPGGDLGIFNDVVINSQTKQDTQEACTTGRMNDLFLAGTAPIDAATNLQAMMECVMRNSGISLPGVGETRDLASIINTTLSQMGVTDTTFTTATLTRGNDDASGNPVYTGSVKNTFTLNAGSKSMTMSGEIEFSHRPLNSDGTLYEGLILGFFTADNMGGFFANCPSATNTPAASVLYRKSTADQATIRSKTAVFCGTATKADIADSTGELDFTKKFSDGKPESSCNGTISTNTNGWGDDGNLTVVLQNLSSETAQVFYAWQAGRCDGNTRTFNAKTEVSGSDKIATAYFGYGPDIATAPGAGAFDPGEIQGMICNWNGPGSGGFGQKTIQNLAQKQISTFNSSLNLYTPTTTLISYAVTNSCNYSGGAAFGFEAVENESGTTVITMDNNHPLSTTPLTNNLVTASEVSSLFSMPTIASFTP